MNRKKRIVLLLIILGVILGACLFEYFGGMPFRTTERVSSRMQNSNAAGETPEAASRNDNIVGVKYAGECAWLIDKDGTLIVWSVNSSGGMLPGTGTIVDNGNDLTIYQNLKGSPWYNYRDKIKNAKFVGNVSIRGQAAGLFNECVNLESIDFTGLKTTSTDNMSFMFRNCSSLKTLDLSGFDTKKVISMQGMFVGCTSLKSVDISNFDTSRVTNMQWMFTNCRALETLNVSSFNTSRVTNMNQMFLACESLKKLDLSNFKTAQSLKMNQMFCNCYSLAELDLSSFDCTSATMHQTFDNAGIKKIKLGTINLQTSRTSQTYGGGSFGRGTWLKEEDGQQYSAVEICTKSTSGNASGTYTKVSNISKEMNIDFPVTYKIEPITRISSFTTDEAGRSVFQVVDNNKLVANISLVAAGKATKGYTIPGKVELTFADCATDERNNKYDIKLTIENITVYDLTTVDSLNNVLKEILRISKTNSIEMSSLYYENIENLRNSVFINSSADWLHNECIYDLNMQIVDKSGNAVDGSYIFSAYDLDIPTTKRNSSKYKYLDSSTTNFSTNPMNQLDSRVYGMYSEGINLGDGFDLSTLKFSNNTLLIQDINDKGIIRGTRIDNQSEFSEFLIQGDAKGSKFQWTGTDACVSNILSYYQPQMVQIIKQNSSGANLSGAKLSLYYADESTPIETWTTSNTAKEIFLNPGEYTLKETEAPTGYNRATDIKFFVDTDYKITRNGETVNNIVMVDIEKTSGDTPTGNVLQSIDFTNEKYAALKGKVWVDTKDGKDQNFNSTYDNNEATLGGITVNLYNRKTNQLIASTTTFTRDDEAQGKGNEGEYIFSTKNRTDNSKLTYWELAYCYVEFMYNNREYTTVAPFVGEDSESSKAQAEEIKADELYDTNLTGTSGSYPGRAVTYIGTDNDLNYDKIEANKSISDKSKRLLTAYYNEDEFVVENINLGLVEKPSIEYALGEQLEYVKLVRGDYVFTYKYGADAAVTMEDGSQKAQSTVALQTSKKTFTQYIYPSDISYNFSNRENPQVRIYVVYKIDVKNTQTINNPDLYDEKALYLTSLTNQFDTSRYELSADVLSGDDANITKDFGLWSASNGTATFNINNSDKSYKEGNSGINPNETESTYIQFKVTENALYNLLEKSTSELEEIFANAPTKAISNGYHIYERKDKNWKNSNTYRHRTKSDILENGSLYIRWKLADTRTISGNVFEDSKVEQLEGEAAKTRENERIGDGKKSDTEKTLKDVVVSLINADTGNVATLYDGGFGTNAYGTWYAKTQNAICKVDENGNYSLPGVVPGRYYLRFTYGEGNVSLVDLNRNVINSVATTINGETTPISSSSYKSTIITGAAKNANASNEKTWFIDSIDQGNYSIATDASDVISSRTDANNINTELKYSTTQAKVLINAESPVMDINFEYVRNPETASNDTVDRDGNRKLSSNCTGMNFGIIERPHTEIELEKTIKNIKLTLQNGTTIINGNPSANVSSALVSLGDSYSKVETADSNLYSSTLTVTYGLKGINKSELDYATSDYYKYGIVDNTKLVNTTLTKIADYVPDNSLEYEGFGPNINVKNITNKDEYFAPAVISGNNKYKLTVFELNAELAPESAGVGNSSVEYEYSMTKLLSASDEDLGWQSFSEIIGLSNITLTPQYTSHSGSYIVTDQSTSEPDDANATIAVTPSTGANRSYTIYIFAGVMLIIFAAGVVLIKKFVL